MNSPRLPVSSVVRPSSSRPRTPRSRRPSRSSSRPPRRPVARVSGGSSSEQRLQPGGQRLQLGVGAPGTSGRRRARTARSRRRSGRGRSSRPRTSPPSRATWSAGLARHHPQPVPAQVQLPDHLGPQHARDVGGGRGPAAGGDLLGDAASADHVAPLEHQRGQARPGEQRPGGEPVVPGADHDDVPSGGGLRGESASLTFSQLRAVVVLKVWLDWLENVNIAALG